MGKEKRRHPRFVVDGVEGRTGLRGTVTLVDLGSGGAAIRSKRKLDVGDEYSLKFDLEGTNITVDGLIVWTAPSGSSSEDPLYSAGIKFTDALPTDLREFLNLPETPTESDDRRVAGVRFRFKVPGKAVLESIEIYSVKLVSLSGMLIETAHRLEPDESYDMELLPPSGPSLTFIGGVRSCIQVADTPRYEIGIEFLEMSPEAKGRLSGFVAWLATM